MLGKFCVIYIFAFSLPHMAIMGKSHSNFNSLKIYFVQKRVVSDPKNLLILFCVIIVCCLGAYVHGKGSLENKITQKGLSLKKICVMN